MVSSWNFTDRLGLFEAEPATADALDSAEVIVPMAARDRLNAAQYPVS